MIEPFDKVDCVALYAGKIKFYAAAIVQLHEFGAAAGFDTEPWGPAYQCKAVKVYLEVLPPEYLEQLAAEFLGCSATMAAQPCPPADLAESWRIADAYFRNSAQAIADALDVTIQERWEDPTGKEPTTPAGVAFAILATYITAEAAIQLQEAGKTVAAYLSACRLLTRQEVEILAELAAGATYLDVASRHGFSSRTIYRHVGQICTTLGVESKQDAITLAARNGWI